MHGPDDLILGVDTHDDAHVGVLIDTLGRRPGRSDTPAGRDGSDGGAPSPEPEARPARDRARHVPVLGFALLVFFLAFGSLSTAALARRSR